jgi:Ser/Thr protein kinase RdoA (MazF antagonist)
LSTTGVVIEAAGGSLSEAVQIKQWDDELYQILGVTIGKIHNLAAQYTPSSHTLKRPVWDVIPNKEITIFDFDDCVYG